MGYYHINKMLMLKSYVQLYSDGIWKIMNSFCKEQPRKKEDVASRKQVNEEDAGSGNSSTFSKMPTRMFSVQCRRPSLSWFNFPWFLGDFPFVDELMMLCN
jgi:hypothetical protein